MNHFISMMFSLLVITGLQVSVKAEEKRHKRSSSRHYISELTVSNGGGWGSWGYRDMCAEGTYAAGFSLKVENPIDGDDTALNGIRLHCTDLSKGSKAYHRYTSVQSDVGSFQCSGGSILTGDGTDWGDWGSWSQTCQGKGICGIMTRVEEPQGRGDDTALNDVRMYCCT
ncbi:vitelline membrane outer layer 1-like protein [Labeo rohita]|uniref:Vitelline membrane outer layer 1-like protein n=1 Tax=Labeo rohita TaxID=84645 RepID=A0A498MYQ3_LABRO|nr:vitelline membrane outer layer 1-like protein [Labeo rohita]